MSYDVNCNLLTAKRIRPKRIRPNVVEKETTTKDAKVPHNLLQVQPLEEDEFSGMPDTADSGNESECENQEKEVATGLSPIKSGDPNTSRDTSPFVKSVIDSVLMLIDPRRRSLSKEEWLLLTKEGSLKNLSYHDFKKRVVLHTLTENCQGLKNKAADVKALYAVIAEPYPACQNLRTAHQFCNLNLDETRDTGVVKTLISTAHVILSFTDS